MVLNKVDLVPSGSPLPIFDNLPKDVDIIPISAMRKDGIITLQQKLVSFVSLPNFSQNDIVVSNVRHYEALLHALTAIRRVQRGLALGNACDLVSQDLRECLHYLGAIVGGTIDANEVLSNIFNHFCIGK